MNATWRTLLMGVFLPLVLGAACDPMAPGAVGQLMVSPQATVEDGRTLEMRLLANDGKPFDVATTDLVVEYPDQQASWNLAEIEFPFRYDIGGGLGSSEHEHWRVIAWIADSEDVDRPKSGEWYGSREFSINDCGVMISGYCGVMFDIDLEIEVILANISSRAVESEPERETVLGCAARQIEGARNPAGPAVAALVGKPKPDVDQPESRDGSQKPDRDRS